MIPDIRWKQRYANFEKALRQLKEFVAQPILNKMEKQGLIQCFEYTFELAWKTAKDYLEEEGFDINSPRKAIQTAYQSGLIANGHLWIDALEKRNLMAHTYDEKKADEAEYLIRNQYCLMLSELYEQLKGYL